MRFRLDRDRCRQVFGFADLLYDIYVQDTVLRLRYTVKNEYEILGENSDKNI